MCLHDGVRIRTGWWRTQWALVWDTRISRCNYDEPKDNRSGNRQTGGSASRPSARAVKFKWALLPSQNFYIAFSRDSTFHLRDDDDVYPSWSVEGEAGRCSESPYGLDTRMSVREALSLHRPSTCITHADVACIVSSSSSRVDLLSSRTLYVYQFVASLSFTKSELRVNNVIFFYIFKFHLIKKLYARATINILERMHLFQAENLNYRILRCI